MDSKLQLYRKAVQKVIDSNHKRGLPVYQCSNGYIVAFYPDGRKVKLEKTKSLREYLKDLGLFPHA